jgi:hypothetical protein
VIEDEVSRAEAAKIEDVTGARPDAINAVDLEPVAAPAPRDCQVSFRLRHELAAEIRAAAARREISSRAFILAALRDAGLDVREDDLDDRRRGGARGPRARPAGSRPGKEAPGSRPDVHLAEILKLAKSALAKGQALQSGAQLVIRVEAPAPEAMFRTHSRSQISGNASEFRKPEILRKSGAHFRGPNPDPSIGQETENDDA